MACMFGGLNCLPVICVYSVACCWKLGLIFGFLAMVVWAWFVLRVLDLLSALLGDLNWLTESLGGLDWLPASLGGHNCVCSVTCCWELALILDAWLDEALFVRLGYLLSWFAL